MAVQYALARITHNEHDWKVPSGPAYKSSNVGGGAFEVSYDFGFEEWLFNTDYEHGSYQYGYIEGINHAKKNRIEALQKCPLILYTFKNSVNRQGPATRLPVAIIKEWKCATPPKEVVNNWRDAMISDLTKALFNNPKLKDAIDQIRRHADQNNGKPLKNIQFRRKDVEYYYSDQIDATKLIRYNHFQIITKNDNEVNFLQGCKPNDI